MLVYICKAVKDRDILDFQVLTCNAWSDNIYDARGYINQKPDIKFKLISADVPSVDDIYKIFVEDIVNTDNPQYGYAVNINDYKIGVYSTDSIHPHVVYATNEQVSSFEVSMCETNALEDDILEFGRCLYDINLLSQYLLDIDDIKSILTKLFAKYIVFDILGQGYYDYYDCDDDFDEGYIKYKKIANKIDIDVDSMSIYNFYDQMAYFNIIVNKYTEGVVC